MPSLAVPDDVARVGGRSDGVSAGPPVRSFGFAKRGERMPAERTAMRHLREVLRLKVSGVSRNEIARWPDEAPSTVRLILDRPALGNRTPPSRGRLGHGPL